MSLKKKLMVLLVVCMTAICLAGCGKKIVAQPKWLRRGCVWENAAEDGNYGFGNVQYCMPQCSKSHCGA